MRVFRRRRIQDYQLRSTIDHSDSKPFDYSAPVPDTQLDGITNVSTVISLYIVEIVLLIIIIMMMIII